MHYYDADDVMMHPSSRPGCVMRLLEHDFLCICVSIINNDWKSALWNGTFWLRIHRTHDPESKDRELFGFTRMLEW
jgi:hypothetical protein